MKSKTAMMYFIDPIEKDILDSFYDLLDKEGYATGIEIKGKVEKNIKTGIREFKEWSSKKDKTLPSLLITDISNTEKMNFTPIRNVFSNSMIMCIHEEAVNEEADHKGNVIVAFENADEAISFLAIGIDDYSTYAPPDEALQNSVIDELPMEMPGHTYSEMPPPLDTDQRPPGIHEERDPFLDTDPRLLNIKEYQDMAKIPDENVTDSNSTGEIQDTTVIKQEDMEINSPDEDDTKKPLEDPYSLRPREIQKQLFHHQRREGHQRIGIWSPLHRTGVTSLTMNFAFFLAQHRYDVTVLEGLTEQYTMKDWLKRYTKMPPDWISYAKAIQTNSDARLVRWTYENVMFLPLDKNDPQYEWDEATLNVYMTTTELIDVTLIDMPTGEMKPYTIQSLSYLDQLWIVVDDAIQETLSWRDYIENLKKQTKCPIFLIYNKHHSFSQSKELSRELRLPVIACIPSLHEETMRNYYEDIPLYLKDEVKGKVDNSFSQMASQLFNDTFKLNEPIVTLDGVRNDTIFKKLIALFKPLKRK